MITSTKLIGLLLLACILSPSISAQHCAYCSSEIFIAEVVSSTDSSLITGLEVSLLDSLNEPLLVAVYNGKGWQMEPLRLHQNPKKTSHRGYIDNNNPMEPNRIRFKFAEDNYVAMYFFNAGMKLRIVDTDGEANGGHFESQIIPLTEDYFYPLCTSYSSWDYTDEFVAGYKPFQVRLLLKKN